MILLLHYAGLRWNTNRNPSKPKSSIPLDKINFAGGQLFGNFSVIYIEIFDDYATARAKEKFFKSGHGQKCSTI
jgi:hypothetical protein